MYETIKEKERKKAVVQTLKKVVGQRVQLLFSELLGCRAGEVLSIALTALQLVKRRLAVGKSFGLVMMVGKDPDGGGFFFVRGRYSVCFR